MFRSLIALLLLASLLLAACGSPAPAQPAPVEPAPVQPAPAEPEPAQPAPAEPEPAEPAPAEPAAAPSMYNEAPMLAEMVAAGDLPPVDERLPEEPLVHQVAEIGKYGGTLRRGFLGPSDHNNYTRLSYDALVRFSPDGGDVIPHMAKGWESNDDFTEWIVNLRPGMKWSDGEPFTADDILFWYNDIALNTDLSPTPPTWLMNADGTIAKVEKVNDYAVKWTYAQPNTAFLLDLANKDGADRAITNLAFAPAHYLKDFHPNYTDATALDAVVKERGFNTWPELFAVEAMPHLSGKRPSTAAWVPDNSTVADPVFVLKRNPYYFAVDQ
jgi:peptide/nickel transport system substrate-binding protein